MKCVCVEERGLVIFFSISCFLVPPLFSFQSDLDSSECASLNPNQIWTAANVLLLTQNSSFEIVEFLIFVILQLRVTLVVRLI